MARTFAREATSVSDLNVDIPDLTTYSVRLTADTPLAGKTIAQSGLRVEHDAIVIAVSRGGESFANPTGDFEFAVGDVLFLVAPSEWDPQTIS